MDEMEEDYPRSILRKEKNTILSEINPRQKEERKK